MMQLLLRIFIFLFLYVGNIPLVWADGSKDMYPDGVAGNRAFLVSERPAPNNPFHNWAAHYVYARSGETIAVASSAQGVGEGHIRLISPNGKNYSTRELTSSIAKIHNRLEELQGPGVGYIPFEHFVTSDEEGIWRIEFVPPGPTPHFNTDVNPENVRANADWSKAIPLNTLIAAWDVSIRKNPGQWIKGRVYTPVLQLWLSSLTMGEIQGRGSFFGKNYVLTNDGYIYKVDGNGSHGIQFYYFVNSSGMLNELGEPSYKSKNSYPFGSFHSPLSPDTEDRRHITHKMFYTMPDTSMPSESVAALPEGSTWLYNKIQIATIDSVQLQYIEGDSTYLNRKGALIEFVADYSQNARYEVVIETKSEHFPLTRRTIIHEGQPGRNSLFWDGLDNEQRPMPGGEYPISISVAILEGEIHFPYFDMEINPNGIKIDRINPDGTFHSPAEVYWDDREIYGNGPEGEKSNPVFYLGGNSGSNYKHTWGSYRYHDNGFENEYRVEGNIPHDMRNANYGAYSFGNEKAMDTWSYGISPKSAITQPITVLVSDLEVVRISTEQDTIEPGDILTYHVLIRNNGPSDAKNAGFEFRLPEGLRIENAALEGTCGAEKQQYIQENKLIARIDIPNGCAITYKIDASTADIIPDYTYGYLQVEAGIVRPLGYTDPDATMQDPTIATPLSPWEECHEGCNNVKSNAEVFLLEYYHERGHLALVKTVEHVNPNQPGFFEVGDLVRYTFTVTNVGPPNGVPVDDLQIQDNMLSNKAIAPPTRSLDLGESTTVSVDYRITQEDINRKYIENTASVTGKNPRGFIVKDISGTEIDNDQATRIILDVRPYLRVKKTVRNKGTGENGQFTIGDRIDYLFEIKHEGLLPVENLTLVDKKLKNEIIPIQTQPIVNQIISIEASYIVSPEDILQGNVQNTALLEGYDTKYGNLLQDSSGLTFEDDLPTVTALARPPQGVSDEYSIYQGNIGVFEVWANDLIGTSRLDLNSLEIVDQPALGRVRVEGDKLFYEPVDNFVFGKDHFTYRIKDGSRLYTESTSVVVNINRTSPIGVKDYKKVGYNYHVNIRPLNNDYVLHSELLPGSIEIMVYPRHGQVIHLGEAVLRYVPDYNFTGYDEIHYRIQDKNGNWSEPTAIEIEVSGFFIPNAFTPNGDNKNDKFVILGTYQFDRVQLEVIDRFGKQIYYSSDYKNDWMGRSSVDGRIIEEGTYFVIFKGIKNHEKPIVRRSTIVIIRNQLHTY